MIEALGRHGYLHIVRVGSGGLGDVYRAVRASTGGEVAIKVVREVGDREATERRVRRELNALLKLKGHPNVVQIEELIDLPTGLALVMEFVGGGSLMDLLERSGRLTPTQALAVMVDIARAIADAHALGIVHRDIKPHNVMIGQFGQFKVCDFGIAAVLRDASFTDRTSALSYRYASPEEIEDATDIGPATDVYSLGVTLRQLLTADTNELRARQIIDDRRHDDRLSAAERATLASLGQLVDRMTARDASARPSAAEVLDAVRNMDRELGAQRAPSVLSVATPEPSLPTPSRLLPPPTASVIGSVDDSETILRPVEPTTLRAAPELAVPASPEPASASSPGRARLTGKKVAAATLAVSLVAVGAVVALKAVGGSPSEETSRTEIASTVGGSSSEETTRTEVAPAVVLVAPMAQSVGQAEFSPDGAMIATSGIDDRTKLLDAGTGAEISDLEGSKASFSPDGTRLVTASYGRVFIWDAATGSPVRTIEGDARDEDLWVVWSSDGTKILGENYGSVYVWDAATGDEILAYAAPATSDVAASFSLDGSRIAALSSAAGEVTVWDGGTGVPLATVTGSAAEALLLSPDGTSLAILSDGTVSVFEAATGAELSSFRGDYLDAFSADGTRVVTSGSESVQVWDAASGTHVATVGGYFARLCANGTKLATDNYEGSIRIWDVESGNEIGSVANDSPTDPTFSNDCTKVATGDYEKDTATVWDASNGARLATTSGGWTAVFNADGSKLVAVSDVDDTVTVVDVATGEESSFATGHASPQHFVSFGPEGNTIVSGGDFAAPVIWDATSGEQLAALTGGSTVTSPLGTKIAVRGEYPDETVTLWDVATGTQIAQIAGDGFTDPVFSPDDTKVVTVVMGETTIHDTATGAELARFVGEYPQFSPSGTKVVTQGYDDSGGSKVTVWDPATGGQISSFPSDSFGASFSPDESRLVTSNYDGTYTLWDTVSGLEVTSVTADVFGGFSADATRIVTADYDDDYVESTMTVWDAATGAPIVSAPGDGQFSPDGSQVASSDGGGTVSVWASATGAAEFSVAGDWFGGFTPDGTMMLTVEDDGTIAAWDTEVGTELATAEGEPGAHVGFSDGPAVIAIGDHVRVWDVGLVGFVEGDYLVGFGPDGKLFTGSYEDDAVTVWDLATGDSLYALVGHTGHVNSIAFGLDGTTIATASSDGTTRLWSTTDLAE